VVAPSLTVATGTTDGKEYLSGGTLFFKGNTSGSFTFSSTVSDASSGVQKTNYPGTTGGTWSNFTHANQDVTGGTPHVSSSISWTSVGAGDSYVVTLYDNVGNTATSTITFTSDVVAPSLTVATGTTDGKEYLSGGTLFFRGNTSGSFTFSSTVSDAASGVQKTNYPGTSGGTWSNFTHANQDVTGGSPHVSSSISWSSVGAGDSYVVTLYDNVGNTATSTITFTSDTTGPSGSSHSSTAGATTGKLEATDTITLTFDQAVDPASILSGWSGASQNMVVRLNDAVAGGLHGNEDTVTFETTGGAAINLGTIHTNRNDYTTATRTFGAAGPSTYSTMVMSGNSITITLGTASGGVTSGTQDSVVWNPSASATDIIGNPASTTGVTNLNSRLC
jgi:hypothetical protein